MDPLPVIRAALRGLARRRRWANALHGFCRGALVGVLIWVVALAAYKVAPLPTQAPGVGALIGVGVALIAAALGAARRVTLIETARGVDRTMQLQDRLSTALELSEAAPSATGEAWRDLVLRDAAAHAGRFEPSKLVPLGFPRPGVWALAGLLAGLVLACVPEYRTRAQLERAQDASLIAETAREIAGLARRSLEERKPVLQATEVAIQEVAQMGDRLAQVSATRNEALRDLANLAQKLDDQFQKLGERPALRTLEHAAREPAPAQGAAELQQRADALRQTLGAAADKGGAVDRLKRELEKLRPDADKLSSTNRAEARAAQERLSQSLGELAEQAREAGLPLASLDEAVNALKNADTGYFLRDLNTTLRDLENLQQLGQSLQQLQQEMARLAKDLPTQLQMGQAKAAESNLQRMIDQLKSGTVKPEDLQRMAEELSKSLDPAREYGRLAEHLKKALESLNPGKGQGPSASDREGAAQHLSDAARELRDLLQQMADADQLASTLETLQRAQMSIGNRLRLGECQACKKPGFGRGGKPGRGVGTWADEEGWTQIPEESRGWDNSGIKQPEMDPRSQTDRGEGEHNPALNPSKVRGQMSPGGSMQSVTLRGVHIKGQSQVKFEEAAAAAQAEAQSALNQDKVPRAYQQGVRDYFDDFRSRIDTRPATPAKP